MITAVHTLIYSDDPDATRAFLRDVLGWPYARDEGSGSNWLIFKTGPSELGVHPTSAEHEGRTYTSPRHHLISLMCDDINATVAELEAKGAEFEGEVADHGYGLVTMLRVPGADSIQLYQPRHAVAYDL
jgi:catechol 2,3-dioxygenase-like lactoylglutathione lyase family enzyme